MSDKSARNQLKGKIIEVKKGATTAHVQIDVGGQIIAASITISRRTNLSSKRAKQLTPSSKRRA
jgi:molybdopterin-binding protein